MVPSEHADQLVDHLASLEVGAFGDLAGARALASLEAVEAVRVLGALLDRSRRSAKARHAFVLVTRGLELASEAELPLEKCDHIRAAAGELGALEVAALFAQPAPAKELDARRVEPPDPVIGHLTLGHKRMLARVATGDRMARFALEPDPRVIRELLVNPRLTEELVVRLAARRPARGSVLAEIWRSPRWCLRPTICKALVLNPYTPPRISLKTLPRLALTDIEIAAHAQALHASVRQLALRLLRRHAPRR